MREDCFAYINRGVRPVCSVLTEMMCSYKKCPFYKTETQYKVGIMKLERKEQERERQREQRGDY